MNLRQYVLSQPTGNVSMLIWPPVAVIKLACPDKSTINLIRLGSTDGKLKSVFINRKIHVQVFHKFWSYFMGLKRNNYFWYNFARQILTWSKTTNWSLSDCEQLRPIGDMFIIPRRNSMKVPLHMSNRFDWFEYIKLQNSTWIHRLTGMVKSAM